MLDGAVGDGRDRRADFVDAGWGGDQEPGGQVDLLLRKTVEVETVYAGDVFAEIVAPFAAIPAKPSGARAIDRDKLARHEAGDARADGLDLAGGLGAERQGQLALGEGHAAPAPHVDVVEGDGLDP